MSCGALSGPRHQSTGIQSREGWAGGQELSEQPPEMRAAPGVGRAVSWPWGSGRVGCGSWGRRWRPLSLPPVVADGLHPGAAADPDGGQAEAVSGEPAANHAESDTVIGGGIRSLVDWGLYCGTQVNKRGSTLQESGPSQAQGSCLCPPCCPPLAAPPSHGRPSARRGAQA